MIDLRSDTVTQPTHGDARGHDHCAGRGRRVRRGPDRGQAGGARRRTCSATRPASSASPARWPICWGSGLSSSRGRRCSATSRRHIARAEMGAHGALLGVTMRTFPSVAVAWTSTRSARSSRPTPDRTSSRRPPSRSRTPTTSAAAPCSRSTSSRRSRAVCRDHRSRLPPGRSAALERPRGHRYPARPATAGLFDTVTVSFSKGLGAPVGSVLVGSATTDRPGAGLAEAAGRRMAAGRPAGRRCALRP